MKRITFLFALPIIILSCKQTPEKTNTTEEVVEEKITVVSKEYPSEIASVFKAHGGIDTWNATNNLSFTLEKDGGNETHTVDLKSRKVNIKTDKYTLGFDGEKVWLDQDSTYFQPGRARFYHNLMFYFYAMPFVLGDDGITYTDVPALEFDGVSYPGTKISFGADVGDAPDDEYILYRDPKTNQMAWLAYTVTYGGNGKSDRFSYIKYDQWTKVGDLQLPSELHWYKVEDGVPTEMAAARKFINPTASERVLGDSQFNKPESGEFAE